MSNMVRVRVSIRPDRSPLFGDHSGASMYVFGVVFVFLGINTAGHSVSVCALQQTSKCDQVGHRRSFYPGRRHYCARYICYQNLKVLHFSNWMQGEPYAPEFCLSSVSFLLCRVQILLTLII